MPEETNNQPTTDVCEYLARCSDVIATNESDRFGQDIWHQWKDLSITSPIEQLLYTAMKTVAQVNDIGSFEVYDIERKYQISWGLDITPQFTIGSYRVDFLVTYYSFPRQLSECEHAKGKRVIVECDSQTWHERTEKERRYEKARDRELLRKGYEVFHYTGKEIKDDPDRVASEILSHVTKYRVESLLETIRDIAVNVPKRGE